MKATTIFCTLLAISAAHVERDWSKVKTFEPSRSSLNPRIVGGDETVPHSYPHQVALLIETTQGTFLCGGSIISQKFILTAAHCVDDVVQVEAILGAHNIRQNETTQKRYVVSNIKVHEGWNPKTLLDDLAVLELPEEVELNENIQLVSLPNKSEVDNSLSGKLSTVSGWGVYSDQVGQTSDVLRHVETQVITNRACNLPYLGSIRSTHICTSGSKGKSTCGGDSGGPLLVDNKQAEPDLSKVKTFSPSNSSGNSRIVGGQEAVPHSFPYQVALFIERPEGPFLCGGSLISKKYVLTAAHCVDSILNVEVILGAHNISSKAQEPSQRRFNTTKVKVHEKWNSETLDNDIAVIELPDGIELNENIQLIPLPKRSDVTNSFAGKMANATGWGKYSDRADEISYVLRIIETRITSNFLCTIPYLAAVQSSHICTSGLTGKSTCSGDSGGPLVTDHKQVGIVSFGIRLGCELGWPAVFTRVTSYLDWITQNTDVIIN